MTTAKEQSFYKKLYYYLINPVQKAWDWSQETLDPCLKQVLDWKLYVDTRQVPCAFVKSRWHMVVEKDNFAYALFQILFDNSVIGVELLLEIASENPGTVLEGFCWLYSHEKEPSLSRLEAAATKTCFAYAKVVYGNYLVRQRRSIEAFKFFQSAALDYDEPSAWSDVGSFYEQGWGGERVDTARAVQCYKKSAKLGSAIGMEQVARCYKDGVHASKSFTKALKWFRKVPENQQRYSDLIGYLEEQRKEWHRYSMVNGSLGKHCDCFRCRTHLYYAYGNNTWCCNEKWVRRWDQCFNNCVLVIMFFHKDFGAKGIGKMVARHLWGTRADNCWKNKR